MTLKKAVPAAFLLICGSAFPLSSLAAQAPVGHGLNLTRPEREALQALEVAARGSDRVAQDAALAAASAAARSADARHALAHYQLDIATARQDARLRGEAVDMLLASGHATAEEMPSLLMDQATRLYYAGEHQRAERVLARIAELRPNDPVILAEDAQLRSQIGMALVRGGRQAEAQTTFQQAVTLLARAIEMRQATGQRAPESWYRRALAMAADRSIAPQNLALGRSLVAAYPTSANWRDALLVYRQGAQADPALDLDILRLMRATEALSGERDYIQFAEALGRARLPGEARSVLAEGVTRGMLSSGDAAVRQLVTTNERAAATERTGLARARTQALAAATGAAARAAGDSHFGQGQYGEAAELYQAALQKGGEDANLVNVRLGAALALAGRRAEAEAALRAVTGPRADLAAFWLTWLAGRPA